MTQSTTNQNDRMITTHFPKGHPVLYTLFIMTIMSACSSRHFASFKEPMFLEGEFAGYQETTVETIVPLFGKDLSHVGATIVQDASGYSIEVSDKVEVDNTGSLDLFRELIKKIPSQ